MQKTNVMRLLDQKKINYSIHEYDSTIVDGMTVAQICNIEVERCFKTLVTVGSDKQHYVFCIPVNHSLNLKKAAKVVQVKSIEMIHQKDLLPLTGYIHGGCSIIGMKKQFKTVINESSKNFDTIYFSGGKVGHQVEMNPLDIPSMIPVIYADIVD